MTNLSQRMQLQRDALTVVNAVTWSEPLFGLTKSAIVRWLGANSIPQQSTSVALLMRISSELGFLATKSQDPIENPESRMARTVGELIAQLAMALSPDDDQH